MLRRIEMNNGQVFATNGTDGGLFQRSVHDGAYHQILGNSQTPLFRSLAQFRRYLYRQGVRGRMVAAFGWN